MKEIRISRIYDDVKQSKVNDKQDYRILVDRIWPRGISKDKAALDEWDKDIAPSNELRAWFGHEDDKFDEFERRYRKELEQTEDELKRLTSIAKEKNLLLLYGAKNEAHNQAVVLARVLKEMQSA